MTRGSDSDSAEIDVAIADSKKAARRTVALLPVAMRVASLALRWCFRRRGGYRPAGLTASD
jgi:hypothetical protein